MSKRFSYVKFTKRLAADILSAEINSGNMGTFFKQAPDSERADIYMQRLIAKLKAQSQNPIDFDRAGT